MEQRSNEWFQARLGKVTASGIHAVVARLKNNSPTAEYERYKYKKLIERLIGQTEGSFVTADMQWGIDYEEEAIKEYVFINACELSTCSFIEHPKIPMSGASPDGLVGKDGLIEVKCPRSQTHLNFILNDEISANYLSQIYWQLACTGREWCDFVSFEPRFTGPMASLRIKEKRIYRNDEIIKDMEAKVIQFLEELNKEEQQILNKI